LTYDTPKDSLQKVKIISIRHKGLAHFIERNDASKLDKRVIVKIRIQLTFLEAMDHSDELRDLPFWKPHQLSDDRWSFHVTANWRMTFAVNDGSQEITVLDLEDYH
jgi:toxin HigB-1